MRPLYAGALGRLPLFGEVGALGLLQIAPMDLRQVEVIKAVASALYSAGAIGGVINCSRGVQAPKGVRAGMGNSRGRPLTDDCRAPTVPTICSRSILTIGNSNVTVH